MVCGGHRVLGQEASAQSQGIDMAQMQGVSFSTAGC